MDHDLTQYREQLYAELSGRHRTEDSPAPARLWRVLGANRLLVGGCTAVVVASSAYFTWRMTPKYEASASIRIAEDDSRLGDFPNSRAPTPNELPTEFQVLRSRTLLEAVADSLVLQVELRAPVTASRDDLFLLCKVSGDALPGKYRLELAPDGRVRVEDRDTGRRLGTVPQGAVVNLRGVELQPASTASRYLTIELDVYSFDDAVERLQKTLKVKRRSPDANILDVSYQGTDRRLVQQVPNVLAARFVMARQNDRHAQARSTAKFIAEQLATLSDKLRDSEDRVRAFEERRGVVSLPDEASTSLTRAAELQAQRNGIEVERSALAELVRGIRDSIGRDPSRGVLAYRNLVAFPTLLHNDAMSQLLSSLTVIEDRRSELLSRRSPRDPDMQVLTARANQVGEQIGAIALVYLQGLTNQVSALDRVLGQTQGQLRQIPAKQLEFARLQREAKGLEEIVTLLESRLKEAEIAEAVEDPSVRLVDAAILPRKPVSPRPLLNLALALLLGLGLGSGAASLREYLDRTVRSRHDVLMATGVPVLGLLPRARERDRWGRRSGNGRRAGRGDPRGRATGSARLICDTSALTLVEAYNLLGINLAFAAGGNLGKVFTVTSPLPGEGKTTVAVNLALTLGHRGARVLLMDGDLRHGTVATVLGFPREPGLSEVLLGTVELRKAMHSMLVHETGCLHVVSRGKACRNPVHLLDSIQARTLLGSLREQYDSVIVDTPPANVVADASVLAAQSDGVLVVARAAVTEVQALAFAMNQLARVRAPVVGAVLNDIDFKRDAAYDEAYRYYAHGDA